MCANFAGIKAKGIFPQCYNSIAEGVKRIFDVRFSMFLYLQMADTGVSIAAPRYLKIQLTTTAAHCLTEQRNLWPVVPCVTMLNFSWFSASQTSERHCRWDDWWWCMDLFPIFQEYYVTKLQYVSLLFLVLWNLEIFTRLTSKEVSCDCQLSKRLFHLGVLSIPKLRYNQDWYCFLMRYFWVFVLKCPEQSV